MSTSTESLSSSLVQGWENPIGTEGFEFVAFASPNPETMAKQLKMLGFCARAKHKHRHVTLYQQGSIRFFLNAEPNGFAAEFAKAHGPCAYALGFRVTNKAAAMQKLTAAQATEFDVKNDVSDFGLPAIQGIGGSALYLADSDDYLGAFEALPQESASTFSAGALVYLDHVTHNVARGNMNQWAGFYERLFNFREIRYFDIEGKLTGLKSRAMTSPCGRIRIPINESSDDKSQIEEYLKDYHGEGIQHIALGSNDIYDSVKNIKQNGIQFLTVPDTYYEKVDSRVAGHQEDLERLKQLRILIDGAPTKSQGLLLQIFTQNMFGPIFFEIIQRKGNEGFGEGNFRALFESIELDQMRRGVL